MQRNIYLAYALWFFSAPIGSGLHRIYCGKFFSGFLQIGLFWVGYLTLFFFIGIPFIVAWAIWWLFDAYSTQFMVEDINEDLKFEQDIDNEEKLNKINKLYEMHQNGALSEEEYQTEKNKIL